MDPGCNAIQRPWKRGQPMPIKSGGMKCHEVVAHAQSCLTGFAYDIRAAFQAPASSPPTSLLQGCRITIILDHISSKEDSRVARTGAGLTVPRSLPLSFHLGIICLFFQKPSDIL
ncbi:unnamed protein product, partial [Chrysoparadoxa australica]